MIAQSDPGTKTYEIKLVTVEGKALLFARVAETDEEAANHAEGLMLRHDCESAEVWHSMRLVRRL